MSIKSTFQELQAGRIKRYEDLAKRQAREKVAATFANVGGAVLGSVINDALRNTTQNFISSAPVMNERIQFKLATKNANRINNIQNAIDQSGKTTQQYFFDTHRESFEEQAKNALAEREGEADWRQIAANPDVYDSLLDQEMKKLSEAMATNHSEAFGMVSRLGTQEEFDASVALATRNAKPSNVASLIGRQVSNMFKGKSSADYEAEALAAIQNSQFSGNAKALNAFMEEYERKGNIVSAYNYAQFVSGLEAPKDREQTTETVDTVAIPGTGVLLERKVVKTTDRYTGEIRQSLTTNEIYNFQKHNPTQAAEKMANDLRTRFDFATESGNDLNERGVTTLYRRVEDELGIELTNIRTASEYADVSKIYTEVMSDSSLVKNPERAAERQGLIDIMTTQMGQIEGLVARLADMDDPNAQMDAVEQVAAQYAEIIKIINQRYGVTVFGEGL